MNIDFSKFSKEVRAKILAALSDEVSKDKITAEELRAMNLSKEVQHELMWQLAGNPDAIGDGFVRKETKEGSILLFMNEPVNGKISITDENIQKYRIKYLGKDISEGYLQDGRLFFKDSAGEFVRDNDGNFISEELFYQEYSFTNPDGTIDAERFREHLNSLPNDSTELVDLMRDLEEASKEYSHWSLEGYIELEKERFDRIGKALSEGDYEKTGELLYEHFEESCASFDRDVLSRIKEGLSVVTGAKWAGPALGQLMQLVVDEADGKLGRDENGIGPAERFAVGLCSIGDGIGDFIFSSEGLLTLATMEVGGGLLKQAASKVFPYIGALIHSYFGAEGTLLVADGTVKVVTGESLDEIIAGGQEIGHGLPMATTLLRAGAAAKTELSRTRAERLRIRAEKEAILNARNLMGLTENTPLNEQTLKVAYKKAVLKAHPDKGGSHEAMIELDKAYKLLKEEVAKGAGVNAGVNKGVNEGAAKKGSESDTPVRKTVGESEANPVADELAAREAAARGGNLPGVKKIEFEESYGLSYKLSTNPLERSETYYEGKKCATNKKELKAQFIEQGLDLHNIEDERFFNDLTELCKTREDFIHASILYRGKALDNWRVKDNYIEFMEHIKDDEDAAIYNMFASNDYVTRTLKHSKKPERTDIDIAKDKIKNNPVLYRLYSECLPILSNIPVEHQTNQSYKLSYIDDYIKTPEHVDAIIKIINSDIETEEVYVISSYIINNSIEKLLDSPEKTDNYLKFYNGAKSYDYIEMKNLIESPENLETCWNIITSETYNLTEDNINELCGYLCDRHKEKTPKYIKSLLDKGIDFRSALRASRCIDEINDSEFTAELLESNDIYELYSTMFKIEWLKKLMSWQKYDLEKMRDYCSDWARSSLDKEKIQTCVDIQKTVSPKTFERIASYMFSPMLKYMFEDKILSDDDILKFAKLLPYIYNKQPVAHYETAKEYFNNTESKNEYTFMIYLNIAAKGLNKEVIERALTDAKAKKNQIKSGTKDISNRDIEKFFASNTEGIAAAIDLIGLSAFEYSFTSKFDGMERLCEASEELYQKYVTDLNERDNIKSQESSMTPTQYEDNMQEINATIDADIQLLNKIKSALADKTIEPQEKIKKLETLTALQSVCRNEEFNNFIELIKPNKPTPEQVKNAVGIWSDTKMFYEDKWNKFCEEFGVDKNNEKVKAFFEKRATVNSKGYKILNGVNASDMQQFLTSVVRAQNQQIWNDACNRKVFDVVNAEFNEEVSRKLDFVSSPDLDLILAGKYEFKQNLKLMIERLAAYPKLSIKEVFDNLPQNIETKRQFEERGVDYEKFITADDNSYKTVKIAFSAEKVRQDCLTAFVNEFNDSAFKNLPKEETQKILDALKDELGIEAKIISDAVYDGDGFLVSQAESLQFFNSDGTPINFRNLSKMMSVIKKAINANDFWTTTNPNANINENRRTFYDHMMKSRDEEISNAENNKSDKVTQVSIQQVDMNQMPYGLMLGAKLCCTSPTGCNAFSAPTYAMNKCIGAFDIKDGNIPVGNTMMYLAEIEGKLSLVLDNIEVKTGYQDGVVRDTFMEYVKQWCDEKGLGDIPIYAGPNRHKFTMEGVFPMENHDVKIIGSTGDDQVYIDYNGEYNINGESSIEDVKLFVIRPPKNEPGKPENTNSDRTEAEIPQSILERNEYNEHIERARTENPASIAEVKVFQEWVSDGLEEVSKPPLTAAQHSNQVSELIFSGKLGETLNNRYKNAGEVLREILNKHKDDIQNLKNKFAGNKVKFSQGVTDIIFKELDMAEIIPQVRFTQNKGGSCNWYKGTIDLSDKFVDDNELVEIIMHETIHFMQLKDVLEQYGEVGLIELVAKNTDYTPEEKARFTQEILDCPLNRKILENLSNKKAENGTVNYYLRKIYKDEFTNIITSENSLEGYTNQLSEREAFFLSKKGSQLDLTDNIRDFSKISKNETDEFFNENHTAVTGEGFVFVFRPDGTVDFAGVGAKSDAKLPQSISRKQEGSSLEYFKEQLEKYSDMDIDEVQYEAEKILQGLPHDKWKELKNPSWYRITEMISEDTNIYNIIILEKLYTKYFGENGIAEKNETPQNLVKLFAEIKNPTTARLVDLILQTDLNMDNLYDYVKLCNDDPQFCYELYKHKVPLNNYAPSDLYTFCFYDCVEKLSPECQEFAIQLASEKRLPCDEAAKYQLAQIKPENFDVVMNYLDVDMPEDKAAEILKKLVDSQKRHGEFFNVIREIRKNHPEWIEGIELENYVSVESIDAFEFCYNTLVKVSDEVFEKIPETRNYVYSKALQTYNHWIHPITLKIKIENLEKIAQYDEMTAQAFFKMIDGIETLPAYDDVDKALEYAIANSDKVYPFNNLDYAANYLKNNDYKYTNFLKAAIQSDIDISTNEDTFNEIIANKAKIVKEVRIKCKDTLPEFADWVEKLLNSENSQYLMLISGLNIRDLIDNFFYTSKIIKTFNRNPANYLNGEYSKRVLSALDEYRKEGKNSRQFIALNIAEQKIVEDLAKKIKNTFEKKYQLIFNAISATDIQTVQQLLDKRLKIFNQKINDIVQLPDSYKSILSDMIRNGKRINKNGQPDQLTGQQKLELINIITMYSDIEKNTKIKIDLNKFMTPLDRGKYLLDIDGLRHNIFNIILENCGMTNDEIEQLDKANLNWDAKNISLFITKVSNDEGELADLIREASRGNFSNYIKDTSNKHGAANAITKDMFQTKHLNYEGWQTGPEELKIIINGEEYTIKLWNRIPQESVFDGTYTSCCTALNASNGGSMANYMLNTAINVVEVRDSSGEVVAMSRCFMADTKDDVPALIIENIEVNNNFNDMLAYTKSSKILSDGIFEYMTNFASMVGNKYTPVYMSTSYEKLSSDAFKDYNYKNEKISLIGKISKEEIYLNTFQDYVDANNLDDYANFYVIRE